MENPIVKVHQGQLRGVNETNLNGKNYFAFRGVPYAKPPIGNLRFRDCEPAESWSGVRDATKFNNQCAQQDWITRGIIGSDDCLHLNVYSPHLNPQVPKAVMVWIHGGAFICGSADDDLYGPDYLIEKDIVLVTINYRVGILGFLNIGDEEAPGNQGLKDQVQALRWVQQNIAQFGGDPMNVTIFGESAGSASVHYLTMSPLTKGLFHKAIMQSGAATNPWASCRKSQIESVKKLAKVLGQDCTDVKKFIKYLRTVDVLKLVEAVTKMLSHMDKIMFIHPFIPSVDSKSKTPFLEKPVQEAAKDGIKVPSLCGYVSHEGIIIVGGMTEDAYNEVNADSENLLIPPTLLRFLKEHNVTVEDVKQYFLDELPISPENNEEIVDMMSAIEFIIGIHDAVKTQTRISNVPMYLYKFDYDDGDSPLKKIMGANLKGTCHAQELPYLFRSKKFEATDIKPPAPGTIQHLLMQRFTELWTNFAKTGNPTPQRTDLIPIIWKPVDHPNEYKCLEITDKLDVITELNITQQLIDSRRK
uniref:Carboxylic ester hydrolase n=1 Tax=Meteorus pulchricornis TaxID=51522 RepID=A0A4D6J7V5_9HYME|nr:carboxylesterase 9 [Meteorus pulchricornis]